MDVEALYYVTRRLRQHVESATATPAGGSAPIYRRLVLDDIVQHPGTTVQEIAERLSLAQSLVSRSVARARTLGLVAAERDAVDRRRTRLRATAQLSDRPPDGLSHTAVEVLEPLLEGMPATDREGLLRALKHLHATFKQRESGAA